MLDHTDFEILKLLKNNCKMQLRELGEIVHLTGQAVAKRISRMEEAGIITGYTVSINRALLGKEITAYITVFMKTTDHPAFRRFLDNSESVVEAHRISGEGCYLLKAQFSSQDAVSRFLDALLAYGNYRISMSVEQIK